MIDTSEIVSTRDLPLLFEGGALVRTGPRPGALTERPSVKPAPHALRPLSNGAEFRHISAVRVLRPAS